VRPPILKPFTMFCDKDNVNQLTAQLIKAGIRDIVVCPGSRNAVLVHNFNEVAEKDGSFRLHPVTDERSAAFYAIGLWLATRTQVAVCVTSGSALLNTLPGVAEAYYRQIPLVIISADRPPQWINQLDGQTLPQVGALEPYAESVQMDEHPSSVAVPVYNPLMPLHINVPISEPLFSFTTNELPEPEYTYFEQWPQMDQGIADLDQIVDMINNARLPAVIVGQYEGRVIESLVKADNDNKLLLLPEIISGQPGAERTAWIEELKAEGIDMPDVVVHIGGAMVNKWLKLKLRQQDDLRVIRVDETDEWPDTFSHLEVKVKYNTERFFDLLADKLQANANVKAFKEQMGIAAKPLDNKQKAVAELWKAVSQKPADQYALFFGNSSAVRAAARCMPSGVAPVFCNRGVNGIEGSMSVAAGYSAVAQRETYAVVGDLSFFYDANALWNTRLKGNLRMLLINDHNGGIFAGLPGLKDSPAMSQFIAASHHNNAEGIALSYNCNYQRVDNSEALADAINTLVNYTDNKPIIIEYDTHLEQD